MKVLLSVFNFETTESGHRGKCNKKILLTLLSLERLKFSVDHQLNTFRLLSMNSLLYFLFSKLEVCCFSVCIFFLIFE